MRAEAGRGSGVAVRTGTATMGGERYAAPKGRSNAALLAAEPRTEIAPVPASIRSEGGDARVYLRPPKPEDQEEFLALSRSSERFYRHRAMAPRTAADFAAFLDRARRSDHEALLVCRKIDDTILGVVEISQIARGNFQSAYLGFRVGAEHADKRTMTAALPLVLRHAFDTLRLHRLEANIQPGNDASIALVRRAGFTREGFSRRYLKIGGRWRDHERWAILREDWLARRRSP